MRTLGVDPGDVKVVDVIRMRKIKENDNSVRLLIVEFKDEYDKWKVIECKQELKNKAGYESFFLELDRSRAERANRLEVLRKEGMQEHKRKKRISKMNGMTVVKSGMEICKENKYKVKQMELEEWLRENKCDVCSIS